MLNKLLKTIGLFAFCIGIASVPEEAYAEENGPEYQTSTSMVIRVEEPAIDIYAEPEMSAEVIGQTSQDMTYQLLEKTDDWACVSVDGSQGYIYIAEAETTIAETVEEAAVDPSELRRGEIIEFAKQFIGKPYVWGGTDPNKGADCSGFTYYIMKHAAGVNLSHSSKAQSNEGKRIGAEEMRPGDLVFYGEGKRINHVAIYAGNGQIVHASTEKTGIKLSKWNYRTPLAIVNVLGD